MKLHLPTPEYNMVEIVKREIANGETCRLYGIGEAERIADKMIKKEAAKLIDSIKVELKIPSSGFTYSCSRDGNPPTIAPVADAEGWIEWKGSEGGKCPVNTGIRIEIHWSSGNKCTYPAHCVRGWDKPGDIVAYRIVN